MYINEKINCDNQFKVVDLATGEDILYVVEANDETGDYTQLQIEKVVSIDGLDAVAFKEDSNGNLTKLYKVGDIQIVPLFT